MRIEGLSMTEPQQKHKENYISGFAMSFCPPFPSLYYLHEHAFLLLAPAYIRAYVHVRNMCFLNPFVLLFTLRSRSSGTLAVSFLFFGLAGASRFDTISQM